MSKITIATNQIDDNVYINRKSLYIKLSLLGALFFTLGIFLNFPIKSTITELIRTSLKISPRCQIAHKKIQFNYFFPSINIIKPKVPEACYNPKMMGSKNSLQFKKWSLSINSLSFSPLGIRLKLNLASNDAQLNIYPVISFGKFSITIKESEIDGEMINSLIGQSHLLSGAIKINALINTSLSKVTSANIQLKSTDLTINKAKIQGFEISSLELNHLSLKAQLKNTSKLSIKELRIGDKNSPIIANIKGEIKLKQKNINQSSLNLTTEVKFTEQFQSDNAFINIFFNGKKTETGFYKNKLTGILGFPQFTKYTPKR